MLRYMKVRKKKCMRIGLKRGMVELVPTRRSGAKRPIIDISVAVNDLKDVLLHINTLRLHNIIYCGEVIAGELLFVMGNVEMRTHQFLYSISIVCGRTGNKNEINAI